jgi:hypothetical protein
MIGSWALMGWPVLGCQGTFNWVPMASLPKSNEQP